MSPIWAPSNTGVAIGTPLERLQRQLDQLFVIVRQVLFGTINIAKSLNQGLAFATQPPRVQQCANLASQTGASPAKVGFEDLAHVHTRRHAQRIEDHVDWRSIFEVRHVLDRKDLGDHALVAVTAGHLVAGLKLALHRHEHLDHLHHARREFVAALKLVDLILESSIEPIAGFVEQTAHRLEFALGLLVVDGHLPPQSRRGLLELSGGDFTAPEALGA